MALFTIQNEFRYEIVRKIFEGGMGIVYEAEQHGAREFVKRVAIKVIRQNYANQKQFIENFIGEAKLVADLIHTNIVQTYHLGETNGVYFIAMELIRGVNLEQFAQQLADKRRVLPKELAVFIVSRVARGLAYAHAKTDKDGKPLGIVHRDVSFKNIMIAFEGDVKLTDFGIAKARGFLVDQEGEVVAGKADYMSPEQANFQITDKRSDLFSAGVVLAHLLLGKNIFKGATAEESRQRIMTMPIPDFRHAGRARGRPAERDSAPRAGARPGPALRERPMSCSTTWSITSTTPATGRPTRRWASSFASCLARPSRPGRRRAVTRQHASCSSDTVAHPRQEQEVLNPAMTRSMPRRHRQGRPDPDRLFARSRRRICRRRWPQPNAPPARARRSSAPRNCSARSTSASPRITSTSNWPSRSPARPPQRFPEAGEDQRRS